MAKIQKEPPGSVPGPDTEPSVRPETSERPGGDMAARVADQKARLERMGVLKGSHADGLGEFPDRPRPTRPAGPVAPVVPPSWAVTGDLREVRVSRPISWAPGGGAVAVSYRPGDRILAGVNVGGKVIDKDDLRALVDAGYAEVEPLATVRILRWGDILIGDTVHADAYGRLFVLPAALADHLCRKDGGMLPSAEKICDGPFTGDLSKLPPCPPPRRNFHDISVPIAPGPDDRFCRFKWTHPPSDPPIRPGTVEWLEERRAIDLSLEGRGRLVDASELSQDGRRYQEEQERRPRYPMGRMFVVKDGVISV